MIRKIIAIVGPTATGKTGIGVKVAKDFNGEIISADSRQVFRGLDLGTGKEGSAIGGQVESIKLKVERRLPTPDSKLQTLRDALYIVDDVPQWLIDIKDPGEEFHLFEFLELAKLAIEDIFSRGKIPVIVGGTGLYIQGLVEGFQLSQKSGVGSREKYTREYLEHNSKEELTKILEVLDLEAFSKVDQNNPHRLIRAIERAQDGFEMIKVKPDYNVLQIGINWPKEVLANRIDKRVDDRFDQGMLEEVRGLLKKGVDSDWLLKLGLEYREITKSLITPINLIDPNKLQLDQIKKSQEFRDMSQTLKLRIRQFAKRQNTWFKRFPEIVWENDYIKIKKIVKDYLN